LSRHLGVLSQLYRLEGRLPEAESIASRALGIREKALGPENPNIVYEIEDLAAVYNQEKRYTDAEPLFRRSLAIVEKDRGPSHPDVADLFGRLGNNLVLQRRFGEAVPLYRRAAEIIEKQYGPNDLRTAAAIQNTARVTRQAGLYSDSEALFKRALAIHES